MSEPAPEDRDVRGYVYFFHSTTTKQTKIGQTRKRPRTRFDQIKNNVPGMSLKKSFFVSTDNPEGWERWFHQAFADRREQGEWFNLTTRERTLIRQLPDYVSDSKHVPLAITLRYIASRTEAAKEDGKPGSIRMNIVSPVYALIGLMDAISTDSAETIEALLLAECERRMAAMEPHEQLLIRGLLNLWPAAA